MAEKQLTADQYIEGVLEAQGVENAAQIPRYNATQVQAWPQVAGTLVFVAEDEDGAGNPIDAWATLDDHVGFLYMELRDKTTNAILDQAIVVPAAGQKLDNGHLKVLHDRIRITFGDHQPGPGQPEGLSRDKFDWHPAGFVPVPPGTQARGRSEGVPIGPSGGTDVDYTEVRRIMHEEVTAGMTWFDSLLGSQAPREDIKGLIQDTLLFMYDPANFDRTGQDATKAKPTRFQTIQYNKFLQDMYFALNKQITGENTQLPVANQGFIALLRAVVHGTEPQAPQQGVVTAEDQRHMDLSGPMGATTENLAGDGERSYVAAAEPDKGEDV